MPRRLFLAMLCACTAAALVPATSGAAVITVNNNAVTLGQDLLAIPGQVVNNPSLTKFAEQPTSYNYTTSTTGPAPSSGEISPSLLGFPSDGAKAIVLSTGDVSLIEDPAQDGPYEDSSFDSAASTPHSEQANDVTTLQISVTVPGAIGESKCMALDYRFLSEEFPVFVNSQYNDAFIAQVDANDWSNPDPYVINRPHDFASDTAGEPVSVNGVGPTALLPTEAAGTVFNAATGLVTTKTRVTSGLHTIYLSIFDAHDSILNSAVFADNLRFTDEGPATCVPPLAKNLAPAPSNVFTIKTGSSVTFGKGTATVVVTIPAPGSVSASDAGAGASGAAASRSAFVSKKKKKYVPLVKATTVNAAVAGPVKLKIKLTKTGLKILNKTGKLKVKLSITFTPTGGTAATQFKTITIKKAKKKKHH